MKRKSKIIKIMSIFALISSLIFAPDISAKTEAYGAFYVEPQIPDNQYGDNLGYFDLMMEPDMEQTISFDVINQGDKEMYAKITFNNGTTELNAEKSYSNDITPDVSMVAPISEMAKISKTEVTVQPNSSETITIDLKAPKEKFDGVSVAGITVIADFENGEAETKDEIVLESRIAYLLALQVRMTEEPVSKNLNYIRTSAELVDLKPQFTSYIQNDKAVVMNDVTLEGTVTNAEGKQIAAIHKETGGILPNTEFKVAYALEDEEIQAGDYNVSLKITSEDESWEWEETVSLEEEKAEELNEESLKPEKESNVLMYVVIGLLLILIVLIVLLILRSRRIKK